MNLKNRIDFHPKFFSMLKGYNKDKFVADFLSGVIVCVVAALPLAIAFGIASGVSPEKGLITAIIGGFIVALLGGSSVQISGPAGSFIVIVSGVITTFGAEGLAIATAMAGVILVLMGLFKLGVVIKFIPYPVVVGFTAGIAVTIFTSQVKDALGLTITERIPEEFISKWGMYFKYFDTINPWAVGVTIVTILIMVFMPKITKKLPGPLIAILFVTVVTYLLRAYCGIDSIETIGDRFTINASIPAPTALKINMQTINDLLSVAFTIAMLCAIESLLSATIADGVTGDKHNANTELMAQGLANMVVPMFGGIPVTGALARTMTNISSGGRTPVAGIISSVLLLLILLFLSPLTKHIPMACLAGVLMVVSYNMSEWRTIRGLLSNPKYDVAVLITTLVLTIVFNLKVAIVAGLIMAVLLFLKRIFDSTNISITHDKIDLNEDPETGSDSYKIDVDRDVEVYEIDGPFFFGMANKFDEHMRMIGKQSLVRIIRMRKVPFIDSTGIHNLESLIKSSHKENIVIILSGVIPSVRKELNKAGINKLVGTENICANIHIAVERANKIAAETRAEQEKEE